MSGVSPDESTIMIAAGSTDSSGSQQAYWMNIQTGELDPEAVMISTPLDKYEGDVYELAENLAAETGLDYSKKKNRVIFPKDERLLQLLGINE